MNYYKALILLLISSLPAATCLAHSKTDQANRNFWHPYYHNQRLNYCSFEHKQCGKAVADQYCHLMGYNHAEQAIIAHNVGLTNYIDKPLRCKGWTCDGFMTIECAKYLEHKPPATYHYRKARFVYPRYEHYRIDWCLSKGKGCGGKAALSFCKRMGYIDTLSYTREKAVYATRTLGSQALCFGKECAGFKEIVCYR